MIHRTPFFLPWFYPSLTWRIPTDQKVMYLTFDDGPVPGPTEFVLDTLREENAKATFFCIGENIFKHPDVFKKIVEGQHTIGNHTYNHLNGWRTATSDYVQNVHRCDAEIAIEVGRYRPHISSRLFRPPYGRITRAQLKALSDRNIVMWDVLTMDYNKNLSPEKCLKNTLNVCREGSIVVFHDSYKAERNLRFVLPRLMSHFSEKGLAFKAIPS